MMALVIFTLFVLRVTQDDGFQEDIQYFIVFILLYLFYWTASNVHEIS